MKNTAYEDHIKSLYNDAMSAKTDAGKLRVLDLLFRMTALAPADILRNYFVIP